MWRFSPFENFPEFCLMFLQNFEFLKTQDRRYSLQSQQRTECSLIILAYQGISRVSWTCKVAPVFWLACLKSKVFTSVSANRSEPWTTLAGSKPGRLGIKEGSPPFTAIFSPGEVLFAHLRRSVHRLISQTSGSQSIFSTSIIGAVQLHCNRTRETLVYQFLTW